MKKRQRSAAGGSSPANDVGSAPTDSTGKRPDSEMPPTIALASFHSNEVEQDLRYDAWRENMGVLFDVASRDGTSAAVNKPASIITADLGDTVLAQACAESQDFIRDQKRLAGEELGLILVQYFPHGGGILCDREHLVAGDMLIIDTEKPFKLAATDYENLTLMVPHDLRASISPMIDRLHGRRLPGSNPMVNILGEHLQSLWRNVTGMNMAQAGRAVQGTIGLIHGYLANEKGLAAELEPAVGQALALAVRRYIEQHLEKPLKIDDLARHFRVSRSQIYRLFEQHDGVASYVWERRLRRSRRLLMTPSLQHLSIGAVAFEVGFTSHAHFSRAFRSRFGLTPSQLRAAAVERKSGQAERASPIRQYPVQVPDMVRQLAAG